MVQARLAGSLLLLLSAACAQVPPPSPIAAPADPQACALSAADRAWLDRAMDAWNYTSREITGIGHVKKIQAIIFDANCVLTSSTAMNGGPKVWQSERHAGHIKLPDRDPIPASVTSFTSASEKGNFFVMSTPSVWREGKVEPGPAGLELLMIAVLLHEGTHVAQAPTYGEQFSAVAKRWNLPEEFNDDSIQERFEGNAAFSQSMANETQLFLNAAAAPDRATAVRLAREARALMRARQDKWYPAADGYLRPAEDIWLSMEGSAQWAGYRWLVDPRGAALAPEIAVPGFALRGKWWSQKQGFALVSALDRLTGGSWKRHAFGDGAKTVLQMMDEAIAEPAAD